MLYIDHGHYNPLYGYYLVVRVGDHGGFPLAIHLIVPIIRLLGVRVWDVFRLVPFLPRYKEIQTLLSMKAPAKPARCIGMC